jgi:hypothetical protein
VSKRRYQLTNSVRILLAALALCSVAPITRADIVVNGAFGPNGDVGFANSPTNLFILFGSAGQGSIYQMDGFVNAPGVDLGNGVGISQQLSNDSLQGLALNFTATQPNAHQLLLDYRFTNNTGATLSSLQFMHFVDPDIGPNFADETAVVAGHTTSATSYQVGDPQLSSIFTNLYTGHLSNVNEEGTGHPGDVSMALGATSGPLLAGQYTDYQVLLSDNQSTLPGSNLSITQYDPVYTADTLTVSIAAVPEWGAGFALAAQLATFGGVLWLRRRLRC